ncbi:MAG: nucleotide exchange factor GrpE [Acidobacteriota bacterium]
MSDERSGRPPAPDLEMLDLEADDAIDLEAATRDALAAVEAVHSASNAPAAPDPDPAPAADDAAVNRLQAEIADLRDRSVRTLADYDNFRKRAEREREEQRKYALSEVLRDFLAINDNIALALQAGGTADDVKRGVEMIGKQLRDLLRRYGVEEVAAQGERFDPAIHEAVSRAEDPHVLEPTVSEVLRRGYRVHERLLRPAMVKVVVPGDNPSEAAPGETS